MNRPVADASAAFVAGAQSPGGFAATPFVKGAGRCPPDKGGGPQGRGVNDRTDASPND